MSNLIHINEGIWTKSNAIIAFIGVIISAWAVFGWSYSNKPEVMQVPFKMKADGSLVFPTPYNELWIEDENKYIYITPIASDDKSVILLEMKTEKRSDVGLYACRKPMPTGDEYRSMISCKGKWVDIAELINMKMPKPVTIHIPNPYGGFDTSKDEDWTSVESIPNLNK